MPFTAEYVPTFYDFMVVWFLINLSFDIKRSFDAVSTGPVMCYVLPLAVEYLQPFLKFGSLFFG